MDENRIREIFKEELQLVIGPKISEMNEALDLIESDKVPIVRNNENMYVEGSSFKKNLGFLVLGKRVVQQTIANTWNLMLWQNILGENSQERLFPSFVTGSNTDIGGIRIDNTNGKKVIINISAHLQSNMTTSNQQLAILINGVNASIVNFQQAPITPISEQLLVNEGDVVSISFFSGNVGTITAPASDLTAIWNRFAVSIVSFVD